MKHNVQIIEFVLASFTVDENLENIDYDVDLLEVFARYLLVRVWRCCNELYQYVSGLSKQSIRFRLIAYFSIAVTEKQSSQLGIALWCRTVSHIPSSLAVCALIGFRFQLKAGCFFQPSLKKPKFGSLIKRSLRLVQYAFWQRNMSIIMGNRPFVAVGSNPSSFQICY